MSQAKEFVFHLNRIASLMDVETSVYATTAQEQISTDDNVGERVFKAVTVPYTELGAHGSSKSLFIQIMTGLVLCGDPKTLCTEWAPERFSLSTEDEEVSAHFMVLGHDRFAGPWDEQIQDLSDITAAVLESGITDHGVSSVELLNIPVPAPHAFVTPSRLMSLRALFVSLRLAMYDHGNPEDLEIYWRRLPELAQEGHLWKASARAVIAPRQRIVLA